VQVDLVPEGDGTKRISILYYKEFPIDEQPLESPKGTRES
jgi:hypothetical protein